MLNLLGRDEVIRNVYRVSRVFNPELTPKSLVELRSAYLDFLDSHQRGIRTNRSDSLFVGSEELEASLTSAFVDGSLNDMNQENIISDHYYTPELRRVKSTLASQALAEVVNANEDFAVVFNLVVHAVFVKPGRSVMGISGAHGGSSSASIGAIWLTVTDNVELVDLKEMLLHELIHHLVFIDELNHPQFNYDEISKKANFAQSAILRKKRPLDKVIHSIIVASEIIAARNTYLPSSKRTVIHPPTESLKRAMTASIESMRILPNLNSLITQHLYDIVNRCAELHDLGVSI